MEKIDVREDVGTSPVFRVSSGAFLFDVGGHWDQSQ